MPIRIRLLLAYLLATVLLAAGGEMVFERQLQTGLIASMDAALESRAEEVTQVVSENGAALDFQDEPERISPSRATFTQVFTPGGALAVASESIGSRPLLTPAELETARHAPGHLTRDLNGEPLRLLTQPVARSSGVWVVLVGGSLEPATAALARVRQDLAVGATGLALLGAAGVWLLAGTALRPVERMRRTASDMHVRDPAARLDVPRTRDEIAALALTFNDLLARLQSSLWRQRRFVAEAGHELRSPLAVLQAELELATRPGRSRTELVLAVAGAAEETRRLTRLADNLLLLAQNDEDAPLTRRRRLPLAPVVHAAANRARRPGIEFRVDVPAGLTADLDPDRLRQALDNLLDNALRVAPAGSEIVTRAFTENDTVIIEVADSGPGFPADFLPAAFERFRRADAARSRDSSGAGLGLAIVKAVAEAHGGHAEAANRPGGGAVVRVVLPRAALSGAESPPAETG
ncbi:ATP-binding protein [Streptosporangium subroseum]|uniref:sensor histidine kinase n=1 Tax=Streptosporangium subroseum TaxID=106412 RepID=UPI003444FD85